MDALSSTFDLDVERYAGKLENGGRIEITGALGFYQTKFLPAVKANEGLVGLLGYWCEGFLKSLLNEHLSSTQRQDILRILCTDFSVQMLTSELRSYWWEADPGKQREITDLFTGKTVPEKLQQIMKSVQELN